MDGFFASKRFAGGLGSFGIPKNPVPKELLHPTLADLAATRDAETLKRNLAGVEMQKLIADGAVSIVDWDHDPEDVGNDHVSVAEKNIVHLIMTRDSDRQIAAAGHHDPNDVGPDLVVDPKSLHDALHNEASRG